ncbi:unnamed protein product [Gongylonema pulchrum]|uniref:ADF-H domain-containing protein n=1 Tax=Gongylonema pulchrum TaxID=637853 RepID=A0A183CWU6_9BILA|nr:unnamed protein product [Gongylonema pulchrum]
MKDITEAMYVKKRDELVMVMWYGCQTIDGEADNGMISAHSQANAGETTSELKRLHGMPAQYRADSDSAIVNRMEKLSAASTV